MKFTLAFKTDFMKDFVRFNHTDQNRIMGCLSELERNPNIPRGNTIKPLKYMDKLWRYRLGDNRLIYAVFPNRNVVILLAIGHRKNIYDRLNYNPDAPDLSGFAQALEAALNPDEEAPPNWSDFIRPTQEVETPLTYIFTRNQLETWQIPEKYIPELEKCRTEEELLDSRVPKWLKYRIIDLMSEPARIEEIVEKPTRVIERIESLLEYREGKIDLLDFLLLLDEEQEKLVSWALQGPTLIKGGAGSGKSTIALYRAKSLLEKFNQEDQPIRILFVTYTNGLVKASEQLLNHLLHETEGKVEVSTVDSFARQIVFRVEGEKRITKPKYVLEALHASLKKLLPVEEDSKQGVLLKNQLDYLGEKYIIDEINSIIHGRGIKTLDEYLHTDRKGRGFPFNDNFRRFMWEIYCGYQSYMKKKKRYTWESMRLRAYDLLTSGQTSIDKYDYVLIDEAQDLTPLAIRLCVALCKSSKGIFLTADSNQSIFNRTFSWNIIRKELDFRGRTRILKRNYRTTREIAAAANDILSNKNTPDDSVMDQFFVHSGPKPQFFEAQDEFEMLVWTAIRIIRALKELEMPISAAAILTTSRYRARKVSRVMNELGLPTQCMYGRAFDLEKNCVKSLVMYSAKGLEFPIIAIPYAEEGLIPRIVDKREENIDEEMAQQRRLLFVGCSRAMRRLFVAYRKGKKSGFLEDLTFWDEVTLASETKEAIDSLRSSLKLFDRKNRLNDISISSKPNGL